MNRPALLKLTLKRAPWLLLGFVWGVLLMWILGKPHPKPPVSAPSGPHSTHAYTLNLLLKATPEPLIENVLEKALGRSPLEPSLQDPKAYAITLLSLWQSGPPTTPPESKERVYFGKELSPEGLILSPQGHFDSPDSARVMFAAWRSPPGEHLLFRLAEGDRTLLLTPLWSEKGYSHVSWSLNLEKGAYRGEVYSLDEPVRLLSLGRFEIDR